MAVPRRRRQQRASSARVVVGLASPLQLLSGIAMGHKGMGGASGCGRLCMHASPARGPVIELIKQDTNQNDKPPDFPYKMVKLLCLFFGPEGTHPPP
jgi:hypothetical protein